MLPLKAGSSEIHVQLHTGRKPEWKFRPGERNWAVFDGFMICSKADFRNWFNKVGFETDHLKRVGQNPGSSAKFCIIRPSVHHKRTRSIQAVGALLEPDLPSRLAMPLA